MKYFVRLFVVTLFFLISTYASAEQKIAYIDMKYILNNSKAGKGAQDFLQKTFKENQKKISDRESKLKKEESDLLAKKTELSKDEYNKKTDELRKKVGAYQAQRRSVIDDIAKQRANARNMLLQKLDPILKTYMNSNDISVVIDKKNIVLANPDLDITVKIVETLNKELPSLNLK